jgi:hypothetical protein
MTEAGWFAWGAVCGSGSVVFAQVALVLILAPKVWKLGIGFYKRVMRLD